MPFRERIPHTPIPPTQEPANTSTRPHNPRHRPVIIPEEAEEQIVTVLSAEDAALVGEAVLTHFSHDDTGAVFSTDPDKPVSFSMLRDHPVLRVSRDKLINMEKWRPRNDFSSVLPLTAAASITRIGLSLPKEVDWGRLSNLENSLAIG